VDHDDDPRAEAARRHNELREMWLNPRGLIERAPEVVPGDRDRIVPVSPKAGRSDQSHLFSLRGGRKLFIGRRM
jgi:hypothetical protein